MIADVAPPPVRPVLMKGNEAMAEAAAHPLTYAKRWKADLIVIGTHGRRGLQARAGTREGDCRGHDGGDAGEGSDDLLAVGNELRAGGAHGAGHGHIDFDIGFVFFNDQRLLYFSPQRLQDFRRVI